MGATVSGSFPQHLTTSLSFQFVPRLSRVSTIKSYSSYSYEALLFHFFHVKSFKIIDQMRAMGWLLTVARAKKR